MENKGLLLNKQSWTKPRTKKLELFKGIAKIALDGITGGWTNIPGNFLDTIKALKLDDEPGQRGWKLVSRSLTNALLDLIRENIRDFTMESIVTGDLDKALNRVLESEKVFMGVDFFKAPGKLSFLKEAGPIFQDFLQTCGFEENDARNMVDRLDSYFVFSLVQEWRSNSGYYRYLEDQLKTPFDDVAQEESQWFQNARGLQKMVEEPVFSESFSLRQVFIPLRAYYKIKKKKNKDRDNNSSYPEDQNFAGCDAMPGPGHEDREESRIERVVTELEQELSDWYKKADKNDAFRVIRGGPGYGKSSCLKMFAAHLAERGERVLFIPLHRFDVKDELSQAVRYYLKDYEGFTLDPFEDKGKLLLLIFDGLDEISMQGKVLVEVANQFIRQIEKKLDGYNHQKTRVMVLLSGRDVIVQQNETEFRKDGQVLRLLPYFLTDDEKKKKEFKDCGGLLNEDQRNRWWRNYGELQGKDYLCLPDHFKRRDLDELTAQPLLNYLVALSYERGKIDFSGTTSLNEVYNDLLEAVYERQYAGNVKHPTLKGLDDKDFYRILEEVAVSSWHGDGRTATVKEIEKHFEEGGLRKLLDNFLKDAEKGVVSLLAAFYFRQAGHNIDGARTFEFTHKSFGEYLTARRIVKRIGQIHKKLQENHKEFEEGWNIKKCLKEWAKFFGPKELDADLVKFITQEIELEFQQNKTEIMAWQQTIVECIVRVLRSGMPMEQLTGLTTYYRQNRWAIESEKALLILLGIIACFTKQLSKIHWPEPSSFGEWLSRLVGQPTGKIFLYRFLNHLDLHKAILHRKDLYQANLRGANLRGANLERADLKEANLEGTNLREANLQRADLRGANLEGTNLRGANLERADLRDANLEGATLRATNSKKANLGRVNLERADLREAILDGANLQDANLEGALLQVVSLNKIKLQGANLEMSLLQGANLEGASLHEATLSYADLRETNLKGAYLDGANLRGADLKRANFKGAHIRDAKFKGAKNINKAIGLDLEKIDIKD